MMDACHIHTTRTIPPLPPTLSYAVLDTHTTRMINPTPAPTSPTLFYTHHELSHPYHKGDYPHPCAHPYTNHELSHPYHKGDYPHPCAHPHTNHELSHPYHKGDYPHPYINQELSHPYHMETSVLFPVLPLTVVMSWCAAHPLVL